MKVKFFYIILISLTLAAQPLLAVDMTSSSFIIRDPIIGTGGGYGSSASFQLISSGNIPFSGTGFSSASFKSNYGFLYYPTSALSAITFDLDTATIDTESSAPYTVPLGTLSTSLVARSNGSINSIWTDVDTNATSGVAVTVVSANGSIKSTSVPGDNIPSTTATMSPGTANYGLCVASTSASAGTVAAASPFNGATCVDGAANTVGAVTTSPQNIITSSGAAVTAGRAQIRVNAAISPVTAAHNDYTDTLTFIATSTF